MRKNPPPKVGAFKRKKEKRVPKKKREKGARHAIKVLCYSRGMRMTT
jgi:hypothetical protein